MRLSRGEFTRHTSPGVGCNRTDPADQFALLDCVYWFVLHDVAGRIGTQVVVPFPVRGWAHRANSEPTATVWAYVAQNVLNAVLAESALVTADSRFG